MLVRGPATKPATVAQYLAHPLVVMEVIGSNFGLTRAPHNLSQFVCLFVTLKRCKRSRGYVIFLFFIMVKVS